jgi:hypothetical protein
VSNLAISATSGMACQPNCRHGWRGAHRVAVWLSGFHLPSSTSTLGRSTATTTDIGRIDLHQRRRKEKGLRGSRDRSIMARVTPAESFRLGGIQCDPPPCTNEEGQVLHGFPVLPAHRNSCHGWIGCRLPASAGPRLHPAARQRRH